MITYPLIRPEILGGVAIPDPEDQAQDLLQWWYDNKSITYWSGKPIVQWEGEKAGDLRSYQPGRCYVGDGSAYATFPHDDVLNCGQNDWIEIEFNTVLTTVAGTVGILDKGRVTSSTVQPNYAIYRDGNRINFQYRTDLGSNSIWRPDLLFATGTEYHIRFKYQMSNPETMECYVNGFLEPGEWWLGPGNTIPNQNTDPLAIFGIDIAGAGPKLNGSLWGIKITINDTLVFFSRGDEGAGDTAYDSSGNGNHGAVTNNYAGFHGEQNEYSYQNEVGYSIRYI